MAIINQNLLNTLRELLINIKKTKRMINNKIKKVQIEIIHFFIAFCTKPY